MGRAALAVLPFEGKKCLPAEFQRIPVFIILIIERIAKGVRIDIR